MNLVNLGIKCERGNHGNAVGFNDDGVALCHECMFEEFCKETYKEEEE